MGTVCKTALTIIAYQRGRVSSIDEAKSGSCFLLVPLMNFMIKCTKNQRVAQVI